LWTFVRTALPILGELRLGGQLAVSQGQRRHILPAIAILADEHQLLHMDLALAGKRRPALPRDHACRTRLLILFRLQNREMRNIGPTLLAAQPVATELIVQFTHPISSPLYLDENRRSRRQKGFHVSQFDAERNDAATSHSQKFQCSRFGSLQLPRRKNREM